MGPRPARPPGLVVPGMWSARCRGPWPHPGRGPGVHPLAPRRVVLLVVLVLAAQPSGGKPLVDSAEVSASTAWSGPPPTTPSPPPCPTLHSTVISGGVQLRDGSLEDRHGHVFPSDAYFTTAERDELRGCACKAGTCFFKCCPHGQWVRWRGENKTCTAMPPDVAATLNATFDATFDANATVDATATPEAVETQGASLVLDIYSFADVNESLLHAGVPPPRHWIVVENRPTNKSMYRLNPLEDPLDQFFLLENGSLLLKFPTVSVYPPSMFCMDLFEDTGSVVLPMLAFQENAGQAEADRDDFMYMVYPVGLMISLPFLVATFAVYATIGELQNLHGKSLMCHVGAMIAAYTVLVLVQYRVGLGDEPYLCMGLGFVMHFAFLACFFWLNIMCFDIWWTFSGFRAVHSAASLSDRERRRFAAYSAYAWGAPLAMLAVVVAVQLCGERVPAAVIRPDIGASSCYLGSREARQAYFLGPVGALLLCNVALFVHTAVRILKLRRETRALKGAESQRHSDERHRYNVYIKLFLIMGVNWVAEILSGFFPETNSWWAVLDVTNSLQGIFIFMIFVGTGRVRRLVLDRVLRRKPTASNSNASTKLSRGAGSATACNGGKELIGLGPVGPVGPAGPATGQPAQPQQLAEAATAAVLRTAPPQDDPQPQAGKPDVVPAVEAPPSRPTTSTSTPTSASDGAD